MNIWHESK